jgi:glyoxylase-like metal-dependent hydrolase (beta-lactamase superfamily II)
MFLDGNPSDRIPAAGYFWVIEGQGRLIAVDTGIGEPGGLRQKIQGYIVEEGQDTVSLLGRLGLVPDDFDSVILTHLHWDHCLNTPLFRRAQILVSAREWDNVIKPRHPALASDPAFPRAVVHYLTKAAGRVRLIDDEVEVARGIKLFWVGGHTPGSQAVAVTTVLGTVAISGDTVARYENIEQDRAIGLYYSLPECYEGMARIRKFADIVLPNHDPAVMARWQDGKIG